MSLDPVQFLVVSSPAVALSFFDKVSVTTYRKTGCRSFVGCARQGRPSDSNNITCGWT